MPGYCQAKTSNGEAMRLGVKHGPGCRVVVASRDLLLGNVIMVYRKVHATGKEIPGIEGKLNLCKAGVTRRMKLDCVLSPKEGRRRKNHQCDDATASEAPGLVLDQRRRRQVATEHSQGCDCCMGWHPAVPTMRPKRNIISYRLLLQNPQGPGKHKTVPAQLQSYMYLTRLS